MTNKFISVVNKQDADRAVKYLESLGYVLIYDIGADCYNSETYCLSTYGNGCYYSNKPAEVHRDIFKEEQLSVPDGFDKPIQEVKEEYVLSGVWQYFDVVDNKWASANEYTKPKQLIEKLGIPTRDLYIKA